MTTRIAPHEYNIEHLNNIKVQTRKKGNPSTKKKVLYKDVVCAFDIETTRIKEIEQNVMYVWQFQIGLDYTIIGRTWVEFLNLCNMLCNNLADDEYICVFVHNLSYEFQFLRGIYEFKPEEVFAIDSRRVLKCTMYNHIELRCSYLHSNMSLFEYTKKMGVQHTKIAGFDYNKYRFSWTPLTDSEIDYITNDVLGLVESLIIEMQHDNDNLYTIPLTSTGYVRRDAKKAMKEVSHTFVRNQLPDLHTYELCREAFRGGNTHANRYYAGIVLHNVKSADRVSSYPDVLCNCDFPVSAFYNAGAVSYEELLEIINVRKKAVLMRVSFTNIRLSNVYFGCPYISRHKCRNIYNAVYDNGRILSADYIETTITDIDFRIILTEYIFDDCATYDVSYARYGKLPKPLTNIIIKYFQAKTELKNVEGEELYYNKSKNKLNAIYGMMSQDPIKQSIDFINGEFIKHTDNIKELLETYTKKAFLCYQWGVWTTAWSRYRLEEGIQKAGDTFVYADTDSVKSLNDINWTDFNDDRIKASIESGAYAKDKNGTMYYMGVYEEEGCYYEFCTLGAKKYCYRKKPNSELIITIAGVTKSKGGNELEKAGGISAFKEGFIFGREGGKSDGELLKDGAGGTEAIYNDIPECTHYTIEGHEIEITSNVVIKESTYTLGITAEYAKLLEVSHKAIDI